MNNVDDKAITSHLDPEVQGDATSIHKDERDLPRIQRIANDSLTVRQAAWQFRKIAFVCFLAAFSAALDGYQGSLNGSIVANKGFINVCKKTSLDCLPLAQVLILATSNLANLEPPSWTPSGSVFGVVSPAPFNAALRLPWFSSPIASVVVSPFGAHGSCFSQYVCALHLL